MAARGDKDPAEGKEMKLYTIFFIFSFFFFLLLFFITIYTSVRDAWIMQQCSNTSYKISIELRLIRIGFSFLWPLSLVASYFTYQGIDFFEKLLLRKKYWFFDYINVSREILKFHFFYYSNFNKMNNISCNEYITEINRVFFVDFQSKYRNNKLFLERVIELETSKIVFKRDYHSAWAS